MPPQDFNPGLSDSKAQVPNLDRFSPYWGKTCLQERLEMRGVEEGSSSGKGDWESDLSFTTDSLDKRGQVLHHPEPRLNTAPSCKDG